MNHKVNYEKMSEEDREKIRILRSSCFAVPPVSTVRWDEGSWKKWNAHQTRLNKSIEEIEDKYREK